MQFVRLEGRLRPVSFLIAQNWILQEGILLFDHIIDVRSYADCDAIQIKVRIRLTLS